MESPASSVVTSTARRGNSPRSPLAVWVIIAVVVVVLFLVLTGNEGDDRTEVPAPTPTALATPTVVPALPTPLPTSSPTVPPPEEPTSAPTVTPTPTPTLIPIPRRRSRQRADDGPCVEYSWSITANMPRFGHNFVEISITNRCGRDLEPDDMWFTVTGWRDGGLVQTARARPFDRAPAGRSVVLSLDLPGSVDWYDEIRVEWDGD